MKIPGIGEKISAALIGKTHGEERVLKNKFSQWDRNPAWKNADKIHDFWASSGKPGLSKMKTAFPGTPLDVMKKRFSEGWIPGLDPEWIQYSKA